MQIYGVALLTLPTKPQLSGENWRIVGLLHMQQA